MIESKVVKENIMTKRERANYLIERLNTLTGSPITAYASERNADGSLKPLAGHFMMDGVMHRYRLERMSACGGVHTPFGHERYGIGAFIGHLQTILSALELKESAK